MKSSDIERLTNIADRGGSRELADELISELSLLAHELGCSSPRLLKHGVSFERGQGNAVFSVYFSRTSTPGTAEVALAETSKTPNISRIYRRSPQDVKSWIDYLQSSVGMPAKSSTSQGYPRVTISTVSQGRALIEAMRAFFEGKPYASVQTPEEQPAPVLRQPDERIPTEILTRRGQPKFRNDLLAAYGSRCAVSGCEALEVLEAAHITPFSEEQNYEVTNGILMRADIHTLFDLFLISVDPQSWKIRAAPHILDSYGALDGATIYVPKQESQKPDADRLAAHFRKWTMHWS